MALYPQNGSVQDKVRWLRLREALFDDKEPTWSPNTPRPFKTAHEASIFATKLTLEIKNQKHKNTHEENAFAHGNAGRWHEVAGDMHDEEGNENMAEKHWRMGALHADHCQAAMDQAFHDTDPSHTAMTEGERRKWIDAGMPRKDLIAAVTKKL